MKNRAGRLSMGQGGNKLVAGLIAALIALTVLLVAVLFIINRDSQNDQEYIAHSAELRVLSQEIAKNATEAAGGTASAFDALRRSRDEFEQLWGYVVDGNPETGLPPSEVAQNSNVQATWESVRDNADSILSTQDAVLGLHEVARTLNETIPQLQVEYDDI
ncbi:MAG: type IV pili methyl-accepting chemotaxis transducer N-terminal domain-containing protein, partial [Marinobacter sp.]